LQLFKAAQIPIPIPIAIQIPIQDGIRNAYAASSIDSATATTLLSGSALKDRSQTQTSRRK